MRYYYSLHPPYPYAQFQMCELGDVDDACFGLTSALMCKSQVAPTAARPQEREHKTQLDTPLAF